MFIFNCCFPRIATQLIKSLKQTWKITTIDYKQNPDAHKAIELPQNTNLDLEYTTISKDIQTLNVKFDCILCFGDNKIPPIKMSDPAIFSSLNAYSQSTIGLMIFGNRKKMIMILKFF